ncbi:MAG: hypothetical protein Q8L23_02785 [Caulobacter sp.]|nr:hypothetical protein [Caulobacter sp.]
MRFLTYAAFCAALAATATPAAAADSVYSGASEESAEAVAAIAEAGIKTVAGVVTVPLAVAGAGSVLAGGSAQVLGESASAVGEEVFDAAAESGEFATSPLSVTDEVILKPQPAPQVPYDAQPK